MKWDELNITELHSLYQHASIYTMSAQMATERNNGIDTRTEKDKEWHKFWQTIKLKCARRLFEKAKALEE